MMSKVVLSKILR